MTSLPLNNINNTCNVWESVKLCKEEVIKPIAGAEIRNGEKLLYILIAANNKVLASKHVFISSHIIPEIPFSRKTEDEALFTDL